MSQLSSLTATVKSVGDDDGPGTWTAVASAPTVDRDDEIIDARAFDPLPQRVPVHHQHYGDLIGSGRPYYVGGLLHVDGTFASTPQAQTYRTLVREGHLTSMSVVFLGANRTRDKDGITHITKGELLAVDWAPIPSNRDSRVLAVRSLARRGDNLAARARAIAKDATMALLEVDIASVPPATRRTTKAANDWHTALDEAEHLIRGLNGRR